MTNTSSNRVASKTTGSATGSSPRERAARLFWGLGPDDVVGAVEGDEPEAGGFGLAGEPVHGFAGHHGEAAGAESFFGGREFEQRPNYGCCRRLLRFQLFGRRISVARRFRG
jgi:hypothetical protein